MCPVLHMCFLSLRHSQYNELLLSRELKLRVEKFDLWYLNILVSLLSGLSQLLVKYLLKKQTVTNQRIFLDSSQRLLGHLWRKHWKKVSGLRGIHFIRLFSGSWSKSCYNLHNQCTSLHFLRLLCLLLHKKDIPDMNSFILSVTRKKPNE